MGQEQKRLILDCRRIMPQIRNIVNDESVVKEVLRQILDQFLDYDKGQGRRWEEVVGVGFTLDFNRMTFMSSEQEQALNALTPRLGQELFSEMLNIGIFEDGLNGYIFDEFLGKDIILRHLPF